MRREALSHPLAVAGVMVATAAATVFIALLIAMFAGLLRNPYAGIVVLIVIPALFMAGMLLVATGIWLRRRTLMRDPSAVNDWPVVDLRRVAVRRTTLLVTALAAVNVVIILVAGYSTLHWMESPGFCGQTCHTPMQPQYMAWRSASHARIDCMSCHVGEGTRAFVRSKLAGVRQLVHVAAGSYARPISPGAEMPPGAQAQTCDSCHRPERASSDRIRVIREYADDAANTETMTVLQMHVGRTVDSSRAIHWHADPATKVEYVSTDAERQTIPYVRVTDANGRVKEYVGPDASDRLLRDSPRRTMDCIDCHNTAGHPIAPTAEQAVDQAIAAARISRDLPYARREVVRVVKASYPSQDAAVKAIDQGLRSFYQSSGESQSQDEHAVAQAVSAAQDIYRRNVFPAMKVTWGSYPDNKGHVASIGCFRCHDDSHKASDGSTISADCEYCHKQIERPQ
jgi:hypothetical protein